jgi:hypothetical protein
MSDDGTFTGMAASCPHCGGQFMMPPNVGELPLPIASSMAASKLLCPQCGSENFQKVSMAHAKGTSTIAGIGFGPGIGPVVGGAVQQSMLARTLSPPSRRQNPYGLAGCILIPVLILPLIVVLASFMSSGDSPSHNMAIYVVLAVLIPAAVFCFLILLPYYDWERKEKRRLTKANQQWSSKYICHRCGCLFR